MKKPSVKLQKVRAKSSTLPAALKPEAGSADPVLEHMQSRGMPVTFRTYVDLRFADNPVWDAEVAMSFPEQFREQALKMLSDSAEPPSTPSGRPLITHFSTDGMTEEQIELGKALGYL